MRKSHFVVLLTIFNLQYSSFSLISTDEHESPMSYKTCFREPSNNDKYINMFLSSRSKWNSLGVKHEDLSKSEEHHPQNCWHKSWEFPQKKNIKKQPFGRQNTLGRRMMCDNLFAKRLWHARNAQVGAFTPAARKSMSTHVRTISVKTTSAAISQKKWRNNKAATLKGNV